MDTSLTPYLEESQANLSLMLTLIFWSGLLTFYYTHTINIWKEKNYIKKLKQKVDYYREENVRLNNALEKIEKEKEL